MAGPVSPRQRDAPVAPAVRVRLPGAPHRVSASAAVPLAPPRASRALTHAVVAGPQSDSAVNSASRGRGLNVRELAEPRRVTPLARGRAGWNLECWFQRLSSVLSTA